MDIEELRLKNIQRNQDLLRQLNLDSLHKNIGREARPEPKPKRAKRAPKKEPQRVMPTRRSRRLANSPESQEEDRIEEQRAEMERLRQQRLKDMRSMRLDGDFAMDDLVADLRLGSLIDEDKILGKKLAAELEKMKKEQGIKDEGDQGEDVQKEEHDDEDEEDKEGQKDEKKKKPSQSNVKEENDDAVKTNVKAEDTEDNEEEVTAEVPYLTTLKELGPKYTLLENTSEAVESSSASLKDMRLKLLKLALTKNADPRDFKLTYNRITSMFLHLATSDRLVAAGDTNGNLGLWAVDALHDSEPVVALFKPHGRTISRIAELPLNAHKLVTASYDGSCRMVDLAKFVSTEQFVTGSAEEPAGISDISVIDQNQIYATTLDGRFLRRDLRERKGSEYLRLHDKKIGGFAVNPNADYQIATASLDRSMRIWDLRNIKKKNTVSELEDGLKAPHLYGSFPSRLSISTVDWSQSNRLVCNGYDDKIQIFDYSGASNKLKVITSWSDTYQPDEKTKTDGIVPENLESFKSINHNCQTGRWVSILKARWQKRPADGYQKFAIANMKRSIDLFNEDGDRLVTLSDPDLMTAVPAVVAFHPTENWIVGGSSSGKVFLFE
ncbi:hypothetical protein PUMCH_001485 [Australozyma saopauloensis]|uniref:DNA damage-binding protein CMR1 n=1 Tax=Australozyma saopauloensis TaxID=291208 RepID=A0AAX4H7I6_9ASCO|nr:hypothetical protein PUMCH_001485 [[Candida] saopauloensis]